MINWYVQPFKKKTVHLYNLLYCHTQTVQIKEMFILEISVYIYNQSKFEIVFWSDHSIHRQKKATHEGLITALHVDYLNHIHLIW